MATRHRRVVWSTVARTQLDEAIGFVAKFSTKAALELLDEEDAAASSLATLSERGRIVPEAELANVREIFVRRYRLIYRVHPERVTVVAFIHSARDLSGWHPSE